MSMIVRANGGVSNGNAGWAPKKSELYTAPPQDVSDAWLEHLCIHEFRHIVQYDKVNQGFTKALYYIFGEQITMAVIGVYVPHVVPRRRCHGIRNLRRKKRAGTFT